MRYLPAPNMSNIDRGLRILLGGLCLWLGFGISGPIAGTALAWVVGVFGGINLLAALTGYCPLYTLTGVCTTTNRPEKK